MNIPTDTQTCVLMLFLLPGVFSNFLSETKRQRRSDGSDEFNISDFIISVPEEPPLRNRASYRNSPHSSRSPADDVTQTTTASIDTAVIGDISLLRPNSQAEETQPVMECTALRGHRYISDGYCRSQKPVNEVVCSGHCAPPHIQRLPWYKKPDQTKYLQWQCVASSYRKKKVKLHCYDNSIRTYRVQLVRTCSCRRIHHSSLERLLQEHAKLNS